MTKRNRLTQRQMRHKQTLALQSRRRRKRLLMTRCHKTKSVVALTPVTHPGRTNPTGPG
jgi:hypothetical protein